MDPKSSDPHSWKMFWVLNGFLLPMTVLFVTLFSMGFVNGPHLSFGPALVRGVAVGVGLFSVTLVSRAISGRNVGFIWLTIGMNPVMWTMEDLPATNMIRLYGFLYLFLMLLATLTALLQRAWIRRIQRKSRLSASMMADAEIDARPLT